MPPSGSEEQDSRKKDRTLGRFHTEAATTATEDAAEGYQAPSMVVAGAEAQGVAILSAITRLPIAFLYSRVPLCMRQAGSRKKAVIALAVLDAITWLPLILALIFLRPLTPALLIVCWVVNLLPGILALPARDSWLADSIPARVMGKYLGKRALVSAAVYLSMFYLMAFILDAFPDRPYVSFAMIFTMAFGASVVKVIAFARMSDNPNPATARQVTFGLSDFISETRKGSLGTFILYASSLSFAVSLAAPFFAVYMVTELHLSYFAFAIIVSSDFIARALTASIWGAHSDRVGALPLLQKLSYFIPVIPLLWLFNSNVVYLVAVQFFSGVLSAGYEVCGQSLIYTSASPEKRSGYIIFQRSLATLGQALGALAGAGLFYFIFPVLGSKMFGIFVVSASLRFLAGRALLPLMSRRRPIKVPEIHGPEIRRGIFSRPEEWPSYLLKFTPPAPPPPKIRPALGLFHRPDLRQEPVVVEPEPVPARGLFSQPQAKVESAVMVEEPEAKPAEGLYHKIENWPVRPEAEPAPAVVAHGLFHKPELWSSYVSPAPEAPAAPPTPARGSYHNPRQWAALLRSEAAQPVSARGLFHKRQLRGQCIVPVIADPGEVSHGKFKNARQWARYVRESTRVLSKPRPQRIVKHSVRLTHPGLRWPAFAPVGTYARL